MITILSILGIVAVPFYELIVRLLPSASVIAMDTRGPKIILAMWIAVAIFVTAIYQGGMGAFRNKWALAFVLFTLLSIRFMPQVPLVAIADNSVGFAATNYWVWKTEFFLITYFLLFWAIATHRFTREEIVRILKALVYVAVAMASYVAIQKAGLDQFFIVKQRQDILAVENYSLVGMLGQPTIVSSFLSFFVPLAIALRKYWATGFICAALIFVDSKVAVIATFVGVASFGLLTRNLYIIFSTSAVIVAIVAAMVFYQINPFTFIERENNGRLNAWKQTVDLWQKPIKQDTGEFKYTLTGFGPGSYQIFYGKDIKGPFRQAHNEYLEKLLFELGLFGLVLAMIAIFSSFVPYISRFPLESVHAGVIASLVVAMFCAAGTFFLELGSHAFPLTILFGLINNRSFKEGGIK